jgi:hypothetical protein
MSRSRVVQPENKRLFLKRVKEIAGGANQPMGPRASAAQSVGGVHMLEYPRRHG